MSILDDHPLRHLDPEMLATKGPEIIDTVMRELGLQDNAIYSAIRAGATPAAALGLDKKHTEALYEKGYDLLQVGDTTRARTVLTTLMTLDPSEERGIYAMAASYQMDGRFETAAQLYTTFITMDATNPEGYLRLGECLMAVGELDNAEGCFDLAREEARRGHGSPGSAAVADQRLAEVRALKSMPGKG
ncbi:tetratricopeptide repeat protein [Aquibium sp. ELW1220]|uniref:tetratricopeptide repeat protein n=1 Tax=Aquibium sp. ELW1220 TaxID=2976766 RepID=UPI0025B23945|nr:tetratricopeptide repeat protein [Aquibium sp. ELW1220]MDN2581416.1 tetratricopeptide repeat protein [Aquibium sp. ELW1220]